MVNTDTETFTSDKTGKKFKAKDIGLLRNPRAVQLHFLDGFGIVERTLDPSKQYLVLEEIIEPVLEVGDWVELVEKNDMCIGGLRFKIEKVLLDFWLPNIKECLEIRKANGEIWIKENGEWKKK